MTKHEALAKIREVIGPEVCHAISAARVAMEEAGCDPELIAALEASTATTHHLRHALAALMREVAADPDTCPNCGAELGSVHDPMSGWPYDCNPACHLDRLMGCE